MTPHTRFAAATCASVANVGPIDALRDQLRKVITLADAVSALPTPGNATEAAARTRATTEARDAYRVLLVLVQRTRPTTDAEAYELSQLMIEVGRAGSRMLASSMSAATAAKRRTAD